MPSDELRLVFEDGSMISISLRDADTHVELATLQMPAPSREFYVWRGSEGRE